MPYTKQPSRFFRIVQMLFVACVVVGATWGWQQLQDPVRFPINIVKVQASYEHISQETLAELITPYVNQGFFGLDKKALQEAITNISPWIAKVIVGKTWPDALTVQIIEQTAAARWEDKGLVNAEGQIFFPPTDSFPDNLPILLGEEAQIPDIWKDYEQMQVILASTGAIITQIQASDRQSITLLLHNGTKIIAGRKDPLLRLQRFVKVYPKIFRSNSQPEVVDLRYEHGLSVKWQ